VWNLFGSFLCVRVISVLWPLACEGEEGSRVSLRGACGASGMLPGVFGRLGPPATASILSERVKCVMTCCIPAASSHLRGARRLRDACGAVLSSAATMAPAGEHLLNQNPMLQSGQIASVRFNSAAPGGNLRLVSACQDARRSRLPVPAQQAGRGRRRAVLDSLIRFTSSSRRMEKGTLEAVQRTCLSRVGSFSPISL
jgi:hypothetical protein